MLQFPLQSQEEVATYRPRPASIEEDTSHQELPEEPTFQKARPSHLDDNFSRSRPSSQEDQGFIRARPTPPQETAYQRPTRPSLSDIQPTFQRGRPASQEQNFLRPRPQQVQVIFFFLIFKSF